MTDPIRPKPPIAPPRAGTPVRPSQPQKPPVISMVGRTMLGEKKNQFLVVKEFAEGGMATIFLVSDQTGRHCLLKQMKDFADQTMEMRAEAQIRFANEVGIMEMIDSPHVIKLIDRDPLPFPSWYVMEKIEGHDLYTAVPRDKPLDPHVALAIIAHSLKGLVAFETAVQQLIQRDPAMPQVKFAHRDLKPENILLEIDGKKVKRAIVSDFGIAKLPGSELTALNTFTGSLCWSSPKMLQGGSKEADVREDIYALGAILYWLFTNHEPFNFDDINQLPSFIANANQYIQGLSALRPPYISPSMWGLIFGRPGALQLDAGQRPQTYRAFLDAVVKVYQQK